jgi:3-mercaptopyruvate sulfurtransferase SseA
LSPARPVVVYDLSGGASSQQVVEQLTQYGTRASILIGGFIGWYDRGLPTRSNIALSSKWVTRERPKIDRIARLGGRKPVHEAEMPCA